MTSVSNPLRVSASAPSAQVRCCVPGDEIDHPTRVEVDEAGDVARRSTGTRGVEHGLVDPQLLDWSNPVGVIDERAAVLDDRVLDRPPTHPVVAGHRGDRPRLLTDLTACLLTGPTSQRSSRAEHLQHFGPRLGRTPRPRTPPPPFSNW